jgi:hypothetical protein
LTLTPTSGAACTPVIVTSMPVIAGNMAPQSTATANVTIDFAGCATNAFFKGPATLSANRGAAPAGLPIVPVRLDFRFQSLSQRSRAAKKKTLVYRVFYLNCNKTARRWMRNNEGQFPLNGEGQFPLSGNTGASKPQLHVSTPYSNFDKHATNQRGGI